VPGNGWSTNGEVIRHGVDGQLLTRQQTYDGPAVGIGYCLENVSSHAVYVTKLLHILPILEYLF